MSIATENLLKFGLLALAVATAYALARRVGLDRRTSSGAALALFLIPEVGWESQRNYSHSVLLTALLLAFTLVLIDLRDRRRVLRFGVLGALAGAALLSKYNAGLVIAALLAGDAVVSGRSAVLCDRRILLSAAIAAMLVLPHAIWMVGHWDAVVALSGKFGLHGSESGAVGSRLRGIGRLAISVVAVAGPTVAVAFLAAGRAARGKREGAPTEAARVLAVALSIGFAITVAAILVSGAAKIEPRWLVPWAVLLPPALLGLLPDGTASRRAGTALSVGGALAALVIAPVLWVNGTLLGGRTQFDYERLAADIEAAGPANTAVFSDYATYANLRLARPDLHLVHDFVPEDRSLVDLPAVAIWDGAEAPDGALAKELADLGLSVDLGERRTLTLRSRFTDDARTVFVAPLRPDDE